MKPFVLGIVIVSLLVICPSYSKAITMPCSMVLKPMDPELKSTNGVALVYKVQLHPPSFARTKADKLGPSILENKISSCK